MNFEHPSYVAIVIIKWHRSSIAEKSIVFSLAVMTSVELPLIMIDMWPGIYIYIFILLAKMIQKEK
jgi:hypothetical protein